MPQLNPRELDVLNILWKVDKPMTSTDIVNEQRGLTQSTVIAVLRKLLKDNLVEAVGVTHSGKVLSRIYRPTETSRKVILDNFVSDYSNFKDVFPKYDFIIAILDMERNLDQRKSEISELKKILADYEKKIELNNPQKISHICF